MSNIVSAILVENVIKVYKNGKMALKGVSFDVREGEIFGLAGPNGSGKTTLFRIISTLIAPTDGDVKVYGYSVRNDPESIKKLISYLPEEAGVYERLSGWENLKYYAAIYLGEWEKAEEMAEYGARLSGLGDDIFRRTGEYSKGMRRRLVVARTLMTKSKLIILDEPTSGMDVFSSYSIRETIKDFSRKNKSTILVSSHNLHEMESLCDRIAFIYDGQIIDVGSPSKLIERYEATNLEEAFVRSARQYESIDFRG